MLAEVLLTRVFSVIYFGQFAFLIISLALFATASAGLLALRKLSERQDQRPCVRFLLLFVVSFPWPTRRPWYSLSISSTFLRHFIISFCPQFFDPAIPFFFGAWAGPDFSAYSENIGRLYFIDLVGASLGSLAIIRSFPGWVRTGC